MKRFPLHLLIAGLITGLTLPLPAAQYSKLWGERGAQWTPKDRLPDFSFAGYHSGENPVPELPRGTSVKAFGAVGDGVADDTKAFLDALALVTNGVIEVPPGRYRITGLLEITRPNLILRGAGPDRSILFFPTPLNEIQPNWGATTGGRRTSNYSWSGGFISLRGSFQSKTLTGIIGEAKRGDSMVRVASTQSLRVGQRVEIFQKDTRDNSLAIHLYSGDSGPVDNLNGRTRSSLVCRIIRLEDDRVHFDRPLRSDLRQSWTPEVRAFDPTVFESGIEHLGFEFPNTRYQGHFTEAGYNAVALRGVADCWVRNVHIRNPDSGLFINGTLAPAVRLADVFAY